MFFAMIKKEALLVMRDKHALVALFVMPAIFILIMSIALKDQFDQDSISFSVEIIDLDESPVSKRLIEALTDDMSFDIVKEDEEADFLLSIPKGFSSSDNRVGQADRLEMTIKGTMKSDLLEILKSKLLKNVVDLRLGSIKSAFAKYPDEVTRPLEAISLSPKELFDIKYEKTPELPSSTQQSVPSWIVFGMFFVIIPMSTIFINERKQNTLTRLNSMNVSVFSMTIAKIVPYLVINHIQVWIMIAVGIYVVPFFDTPALEINGSLSALVLLSVSLSMAAVGLSTLIAVSATSSEQATTIGGVLNILLGAIGGIMVPKFIMPESMQRLADISPMSWGLDGFLDIFLRSGDMLMVMNESLLLVFFGVIAFMLSVLILQIRIGKGL